MYKYILPFTPKFPQDFQGPLVDKYLTIKFEEMEEKLRKEKEEKAQEEEGNTAKPENGNELRNDEDDDGSTIEGESEYQKQVVEQFSSPPHIESTTQAQLAESTSTTTEESLHQSTISYEHEQQLQSIEPQVEIKNVGASGHLTHVVELS